jgi:aspartokinase-like uncharacterized kinase
MAEPGSAIRVVKLGGSLLDCPDIVGDFRRWLALQPPRPTLLVVGGGAAADAVRRIDRATPLGDSAAHWLAIAAMSANARAIAAGFPEAASIDRPASIGQLDGDRQLGILDAEPFLRAADIDPDILPHGWEVTSDSIAAYIARMTTAHELVLLKSRLPPEPATIQQAVATEYVDRWFASAAAGLNYIRCVDLRHPAFAECRLT